MREGNGAATSGCHWKVWIVDETFNLLLRLLYAYFFQNLQKRSFTCRERGTLHTSYPQYKNNYYKISKWICFSI